jgi:RNA recognition motif-containing protein
MIQNPDGQFRGFAFIDFNDAAVVQNAINDMNQTIFEGITIILEKSKRKWDDRPAATVYVAREALNDTNGDVTLTIDGEKDHLREDTISMEISHKDHNIIGSNGVSRTRGEG